jgi:Acetyltransferase (GNAT) domain
VGLCLKEPRSGWSSHWRSTRIIELGQAEDALFRACSKSTRYEIERARRRDNVRTALLPSSDERVLLEFAQYYDSFAATKNVPPLRRDQFTAMARSGKLVISTARNEDGGLLATHAYFVDQSRARLTHSASMFRVEAESAERYRIARVNRLLQWDDMIRFRASGVKTYDMGGWYTGGRDQAQLRINAFKKEFGGRIVHEWDIFRPGSALGWLYLRGRELAITADVA